MTSDPIADMLTRVRNAIAARHPKVDVPASKVKTEIVRVLLREKYINNFKSIDDEKQGWKGRGLWTTSGTRALFHSESGKEGSPKVVKLQMRPDPLAK